MRRIILPNQKSNSATLVYLTLSGFIAVEIAALAVARVVVG